MKPIYDSYAQLKLFLRESLNSVAAARALPTLNQVETSLISESLVDQRQALLSEQSFALLPKPVQTLLKALKDLKLDLCAYNASCLDNEYTVCLDAWQSAFLRMHCVLTEASNQVSQLYETITSDPDPEVQNLLHDISVYDSTLDTPFKDLSGAKIEDILRVLETMLNALRKRIFEAFERQESFSLKKNEPNIKQVRQRIEESQKLRQRLESLAEGPLAKLFEHKEVYTEPVDTSIVFVPSSAKDPDQHLKDLYARTQTLLLQYRTLFERRVRQKFSDIALVHASVCEKLEQEYTLFLDPSKRPQQQSNKTYEAADASLQQEISLMLGTLTVDRQSFMTSLRDIKDQVKQKINLFEHKSELRCSQKVEALKQGLIHFCNQYLTCIK